MLSKSSASNEMRLFTSSLKEQLNTQHPLYILANKIDWKIFDNSFSSLYSKYHGRPAKPIRLMVGLLMLKHLRNISDEQVVEQWSENVYYQYFTGESFLSIKAPCEASELVHFRKRIGEKGVELIFKESIRINGEDSKEEDISMDTTVQEKAITFPTDDKLHKKIIDKSLKIAKEEGIQVRQTYTRELKKLSYMQRFRRNRKYIKQVKKADKRIKIIAGRLVRELARHLPPEHVQQNKVCLFAQVLKQNKETKYKIYSLHEPEVCCISKGKAHKKYEFGNKVSIAYTQQTGVIVGAVSFRNEYDGHTLADTLSQVEKNTEQTPKSITVDRGYKGQTKIGGTIIHVPDTYMKGKMKRITNKIRDRFRRRAAIEPIIGHLKQDNRLGRNFYRGLVGDSINVLLAAAAFNLKRMLNKWKSCWLHFLFSFFNAFFPKKNYSWHP
jgi:IS5 family transposase